MIREGRALSRLHDHVVVKVPFSPAGLEATRELTSEGIRVNMTLVFSAAQALLTAEAGATYVSCFMGRVDDIAVDATAVLAEIVEAVRGSEAQVLAASLRHPMHAVTAATLGCDVSTVPAKVLKQMLVHPLTDRRDRQVRGRLAVRPALRRVAVGPRRGRARAGLALRTAVGFRPVPVLQRKELEESPLADLHAIASELGIERYRALRQAELVKAILEAQGGEEAPEEESQVSVIRCQRRSPSLSPRKRPPRSRRRLSPRSLLLRRAILSPGFSTFFPTGPGSSGPPRVRTSISLPRRSAGVSCAPATRWPGRRARRGATSAIPRWCAWRP